MPSLGRDPNTYYSSDVVAGDAFLAEDHNNLRTDLLIARRLPKTIENKQAFYYGKGAYVDDYNFIVAGGEASNYNSIIYYYNEYTGVYSQTILSSTSIQGTAKIGDYLYVWVSEVNTTPTPDLYRSVLYRYLLTDSTLGTKVEMHASDWGTSVIASEMRSDGEFLYINSELGTDGAKRNVIKKYAISGTSITYSLTTNLPVSVNFIVVVDGAGYIYVVEDAEYSKVNIYNQAGTLVHDGTLYSSYSNYVSIEGLIFLKNGDIMTQAITNKYIENL